MSYSTVNRCAFDQAFFGRLVAASAQESLTQGYPVDASAAASALRWPVASAADIEAAYASALAADNPNPGGDETVITDQMILSSVQANWTHVPVSPA